jgi:hypothetical protein
MSVTGVSSLRSSTPSNGRHAYGVLLNVSVRRWDGGGDAGDVAARLARREPRGRVVPRGTVGPRREPRTKPCTLRPATAGICRPDENEGGGSQSALLVRRSRARRAHQASGRAGLAGDRGGAFLSSALADELSGLHLPPSLPRLVWLIGGQFTNDKRKEPHL